VGLDGRSDANREMILARRDAVHQVAFHAQLGTLPSHVPLGRGERMLGIVPQQVLELTI
jgi:hypothetical protein